MIGSHLTEIPDRESCDRIFVSCMIRYVSHEIGKSLDPGPEVIVTCELCDQEAVHAMQVIITGEQVITEQLTAN